MSEQTFPSAPTLEHAGRTYAQVIAEMQRAVEDPDHPFRLPVLATVGRDGSPEARIVVLRHAEMEERKLRFHTDARSPKSHEIAGDCRVTLLFYHPVLRCQVRVLADARVHTQDDVARSAWDSSREPSLFCYAAPDAPGSPIQSGWNAPPILNDRNDPRAFANFAAVVCRIHTLDVLVLRDDGHRRGVITWVDDRPVLTRVAP